MCQGRTTPQRPRMRRRCHSASSRSSSRSLRPRALTSSRARAEARRTMLSAQLGRWLRRAKQSARNRRVLRAREGHECAQLALATFTAWRLAGLRRRAERLDGSRIAEEERRCARGDALHMRSKVFCDGLAPMLVRWHDDAVPQHTTRLLAGRLRSTALLQAPGRWRRCKRPRQR